MSFRGNLRPGQGFRPFTVYVRTRGITATGRPQTERYEPAGSFHGIISQASPREQEQWKQLGTPISHTIVQRGTENRADGDDCLALTADGETRYFLVQGKPHDPGELHHFLVYHVLERRDLNELHCSPSPAGSNESDSGQHPAADGLSDVPGGQ